MINHPMKPQTWLGGLLLFGGSLLLSAPLHAAPINADGELVAVSSRVSTDYVRAKLPNGSFQPETYTFGKGGYWSGEARDPTIDQLDFMSIARTIAGPLEAQGYIPGHDPKATKLLIMVYWGTTRAPEHASGSIAYQNVQTATEALARASTPADKERRNEEFSSAMAMAALENHARDQVNAKNAAMLGYDSWWESTQGFENGAFSSRRQDMMDELEGNRYFVVLMAYDFQLMWKEKKHKLLWETRYSISEHRNEFDKQLAAMSQEASKYFGRDSHGLVHKEATGTVDLGDLKIIGVEPEKK